MPSRFHAVTRDEFHEFLTGLGFVPLTLKGVVELVYGKIVMVGGHRLSLRCYTAVDPGGQSREKGTDAIRLQLFHKIQDHIVAVGKPQKCLRVESWRENIAKAISRVTDAENLRACPACGHPMVLRRNGATGQEFWGCSAFRLTGCRGQAGNRPVIRSAQDTTTPIGPRAACSLGAR